MKLDRDAAQRLLSDLAGERSLASSAGAAQQSAPHGSNARHDLAGGAADTRSKAAKLRDEAIAAGVISDDGQLTAAAREAGVRAGTAFSYRPR